MATRTSSGLLPILLIAAVVVVVGPQFIDGMPNLLGDLGSSTDASTEYAVAPGAKPQTDKCTAQQILKDRQCDDLKIVVLDAAKMPFITRNIQLAWTDGQPFILTRASQLQNANRAKACTSSFVRRFPKSSCDEYPFASTQEGGSGARVEEVHLDEQNCQGGTLSRGYQTAKIANGDQFLVVISHPDKIGQGPWEGQEVKAGTC